MVHFKVIIPSYNSVKWLRKTLNSVACQTYKNYSVCVIDDASDQPGQKEIIQEFCTKYHWTPLFRKTNHGALANIVDGISTLCPQDDDVILLLDGDDWLYNRFVFSKLSFYYQKEPLILTYGQFITYPRWQVGFCAPLPQDVLQKQNYREAPFSLSHSPYAAKG